MPGRAGDDRRGLGEAVALGELEAEPLVQPADRLLGHLRRAVSASRTVAKLSAGASSKWLNASHSGGAPGMTVTLRSRIVSSAVDGSKRWTSTTVAPRGERDAEHDVEAEDVEHRQHAVDDVVGLDLHRRRVRPWSRLPSRLPWLSIAARGEPAVPLVKIRTASVSGVDLDDVRPASAASSRSNVRARRRRRSARWRRRARPSAPWRGRPRATPRPPTGRPRRPWRRRCDSSRSSSGAGLVGLSGTATAPRPSAGEVRHDEEAAVARTAARPGRRGRRRAPASPPRMLAT